MLKRIVLFLVALSLLCPAVLAEMLDNGDGTVTDTETGLMWQKADAGLMTWEAALTYCESLSLAEHDDWRLPNRNELLSIVDYDHDNPAIDTTAFPDARSENYWSSTTYANSTDYAWVVDFFLGHVKCHTSMFEFLKSLGSHYVRAVRGGQ